jgi:hypothetical protein
MAVWRALKRIDGGEYLQDGVFVVRATRLNDVTLEDLAHDIRNAGGEATIATATVDDEKHLLARLQAAADATRVAAQEPTAASRKERAVRTRLTRRSRRAPRPT